MTRESVRILKRGARAGTRAGAAEADRALSADCALALLGRSIRFAHGRLAVLRLAMAVEAGAEVPHEHWRYCSEVAAGSPDAKVRDLYRAALGKSATAPGT